MTSPLNCHFGLLHQKPLRTYVDIYSQRSCEPHGSLESVPLKTWTSQLYSSSHAVDTTYARARCAWFINNLAAAWWVALACRCRCSCRCAWPPWPLRPRLFSLFSFLLLGFLLDCMFLLLRPPVALLPRLLLSLSPLPFFLPFFLLVFLQGRCIAHFSLPLPAAAAIAVTVAVAVAVAVGSRRC